MTTRRFIALIGSPRRRGTSERLGSFLAEALAARGWATDVLSVPAALRTPERWAALEMSVRTADAVALSLPLYVDALPGPLTCALERLAAARQAVPPDSRPWLVALVNSGFLEAEQNDVAVEICRLFAREAGFTWAGGLAIGGGGAMAGQPLDSAHGLLASIHRALTLTVEALDTGQPIPADALALARRRLMPRWLYMGMANLGMYLGARKHHALTRMNARPYA
jgi:hypothetical protein